MRRIHLPSDGISRLYRHGGRRVRGRDPALDFSVNVNPLGPPPTVLKAVRRALKKIGCYPDPKSCRLIRVLANLHGLQPRQVIAGNGANELIYAVARALGPKRVAIVEPTYTEYLRASRLVGAQTDHWIPAEDLQELRPFDPSGADLLWLCNPNNPTGQLWRPEVLQSWIAAFPRTIFVVDESFLLFLRDRGQHSLIPALRRFSNLIVLRSLTKIYTFPGLRLGYAATNPQLAERIKSEVVPWSVNGLAQAAGVAALNAAGFLERTHEWLELERKNLLGQLVALGPALEPLPSQANFVLTRLREKRGPELARALAARGFGVRDAGNFIGLDHHYLRLAVRLPEQNCRLMDALKAVLAPVSLTPR